MKCYEYTKVTSPSVDELNELGFGGWELVSIEPATDMFPSVYIFKRELSTTEIHQKSRIYLQKQNEK